MNITPLKTRRLAVEMREASIREQIAVLDIPEYRSEAAISAFLKPVCGQDSRSWTVQERMLAVAHYLAHVSDDGPDFQIGEHRFSDYMLQQDIDADSIEIGEIDGAMWHMRQLSGAMAEVIEELQGQDGFKGRGSLHWDVGMMAAQLYKASDESPPEPTDGTYPEWLKVRMLAILDYPESVFVQLWAAFKDGQEKLAHLFLIDCDDIGLIARGAGADIPPTRFRADTCFSSIAKRLCQKTARERG